MSTVRRAPRHADQTHRSDRFLAVLRTLVIVVAATAAAVLSIIAFAIQP